MVRPLAHISSLVKGNLLYSRAETVVDLVNVAYFLGTRAMSVAENQGDKMSVFHVNLLTCPKMSCAGHVST